MTTRRPRLELTWIGKDARPRLEPRILLEDPARNYHAARRVTDHDLFDNRLIFGDNLLALKALEQEFTGKVKCIYIDPPFNTGQAFEYYDDWIEHSLWLSLMRERLELTHRLLHPEGVIWVHLDDVELHYCKILLDEIFLRQNFVAQIVYERSGSAGIGQGGTFVNTAEYILVYKKESFEVNEVTVSRPIDFEVMKRYSRILVEDGSRKLVRDFLSKSNGEVVKVYRHANHKIETISLRDFEKRLPEIETIYVNQFPRIFRTTNPQKENEFQNDLISEMDSTGLYSVEYVPSRGKYKGRKTTLYYLNRGLFAWLRDTAKVVDGQVVKSNKLTDIWIHADIPKADLANEGSVEFRRGKKPEQLLKRIIELSTNPGDLVLDSFAGSGTTGAVAHKMGRRWIMVELGEHCHTHIIPRLKKVIDGTDMGGISKAVEWQGGGGFRYYHLAASLLEKDKWGNWVINKTYNAAMLAEAVCKLEGFAYAPSESIFWQHGQSTERDYIYVTTQNLSAAQLQHLSDEVGAGRTLLVLCAAFRGKSDRYPNLTLKKIPSAVLARCEWGKDDYSLRVENLPQATSEPKQASMFDRGGQ